MSFLDTLKEAGKLDAWLVLGGEDPVKQTRSEHTAALYHGIAPLTDERAERYFIISTGGHGGRPRKDEVPHGLQITQRLIERGVPQETIATETTSLDTVANFVLSRRLLDEIDAWNIGLITDSWHMDRALSFGRYIYGSAYQLIPLPSELSGGGNPGLAESLVKAAVHIDWRTFTPVRRGDKRSFEHHLERRHVYHGTNPGVSLYRGLDLMRIAKEKFDALRR